MQMRFCMQICSCVSPIPKNWRSVALYKEHPEQVKSQCYFKGCLPFLASETHQQQSVQQTRAGLFKPVALQTAEILGGAKYFECKRATVFGLGHRVSKHKTRYATIFFGGHGSFGHRATPVVANTRDLQNYCLSTAPPTYIDLSKSLCGMLSFQRKAIDLWCS